MNKRRHKRYKRLYQPPPVDKYNISFKWGVTNTNGISLTSVFSYTINTTFTTGDIYIPYPAGLTQKNQTVVLGFLLIFLLAGASVGKPTLYIMVFGILILTGTLNSNESSVLSFTLILLLTTTFIYRIMKKKGY